MKNLQLKNSLFVVMWFESFGFRNRLVRFGVQTDPLLIVFVSLVNDLRSWAALDQWKLRGKP